MQNDKIPELAGAGMIIPVILSGGSGTRLWPISRKAYPKQFTAVAGDQTLYQGTLDRFSGDGFAHPIVIATDPFRFIVAEQAAASGATPQAIFLEPEGRNSAAAALVAVLHAHAVAPDALLLITPCDHVIADPDAFRMAVLRGRDAALSGQIVTFGIRPNRPETGYGYLELADGDGPTIPLRQFVEKPDHATATQMLQTGRHLWNAGVFLATARTLLAAYERFVPDMVTAVAAARSGAVTDLDFIRLAPAPWADAQDISIDYAIMERSENLSVVPYDGAWTDLGDWEAVRRETPTDATGNVVQGTATAIECENTLLRSDDPETQLVGLGLSNIIAVATGDAVLIADASRAQDVRVAVTELRKVDAPQADEFRRAYRPWGWYETLSLGPRFQVKRIVVKPGGVLSLQSHQHRSEHWIVVEGTATVTIGDEVKLVTENQSVYIPLGAHHRMENAGKLPMALIEVQTGAYLGEDDITRYEDIYGRG